MLATTASMQQRTAMYNANAFKIGLFGANCSSGRSATKVPERWSASWPDCLKLARWAMRPASISCCRSAAGRATAATPIFMAARSRPSTWAAGLLAATKRITVFGTVHAPLFNPIIAAKEFVTVDHIGEGRFGINLVVGWNEGEFEMFGVARGSTTRATTTPRNGSTSSSAPGPSTTTSTSPGQYLKLKGVRAFPKPYGETRPIIMNAGRSGVGQAFALKNCDAFFTATVDSRAFDRGQRQESRGDQGRSASIGREIDVYTVGQVVCRPTQKEADEYYRYAVIDNADWGAIEQMMALKNVTRQTVTAEVFAQQQQYYAGKAIGGYPFVGTPDRVAEELANISRAGMRGIAVSFVNYLNEIPYFCDEVLPRLARLGIRQPH